VCERPVNKKTDAGSCTVSGTMQGER
jgi:hypothetical protein